MQDYNSSRNTDVHSVSDNVTKRTRMSLKEQKQMEADILFHIKSLLNKTGCNVKSDEEVYILYQVDKKKQGKLFQSLWKPIDEIIKKSYSSKAYTSKQFQEVFFPRSQDHFPQETREKIDAYVLEKFQEFKTYWSKGEMDAYRLALKNQAVKDFKLKENALIYNYYSEVSRINHKIVRLIEGLTEGSKQKLKKTKSSPQSQNQQHSRVVGSFSSQQSYSFDSFGQNQECSSLIKVSDQSTQYTTYIFKGCPLEPFDQIW
ncbi:Hypothetical_protein [Hexamita inflata]|uniref:Hypothetical_protein n=1 Tax=Hexamita inflata TaxID=28002 RepID=A0AA86QR67_9EUKA|nr:Hypothetical protein HINF_LOCUS44125 [Hexamita inflata]